jgi:hypothetical protein
MCPDNDDDKLLTIDDARFYTIDGAVALINETGIPLPKSRFLKDSAAGIAPRPDAIYGKRFLYKGTAKILAYARTLVKAYPPGAA